MSLTRLDPASYGVAAAVVGDRGCRMWYCGRHKRAHRPCDVNHRHGLLLIRSRLILHPVLPPGFQSRSI